MPRSLRSGGEHIHNLLWHLAVIKRNTHCESQGRAISLVGATYRLALVALRKDWQTLGRFKRPPLQCELDTLSMLSPLRDRQGLRSAM